MPVAFAGGNHWALRDAAARCLAALTCRFSQPQLNLVPRISSLCLATLLDASKPLSSHFGAIKGLAVMGSRAVRMLLLPHLHEYYKRLVPILSQVRPLTSCFSVFCVNWPFTHWQPFRCPCERSLPPSADSCREALWQPMQPMRRQACWLNGHRTLVHYSASLTTPQVCVCRQ
jgi:hypothetical protein